MVLYLGEWLVLVIMVGMVLYSLWEVDKNKLVVIVGCKIKFVMYKEIIGFLWLLISVLFM